MTPKEIIEFIREGSAHPMKPRELAKALNIPESEYKGFRKTLVRMQDSGELIELKRGRIGLADQLNILVGTITINRKGMGFLPREDDDQDLAIPKPD